VTPYLRNPDSELAVPISTVCPNKPEGWLANLSGHERSWVEANGFEGKGGQICLLPTSAGQIGRVLLGADNKDDPWIYGELARSLPHGVYRLDSINDSGERMATLAAMAWAMGGYSFDRYLSEKSIKHSSLIWPELADRAYVKRSVAGSCLTRDLINTPAEDMGPDVLADEAKQLAGAFGATIEVIVDDELLNRNYPAIHTIGRAAAKPPMLIDVRWGSIENPMITLVGKGVCFDTGGLDLKPSSSMRLMKKDMGGAANILGLAHMIMAADLPVRLRVLIPAVENAIAGNAYRPGDIVNTRKGITVEIGNTDAEGRVVLADAISEAVSESPMLLVDCATLTGAARVALGPDMPAMFSNDDELAQKLGSLANLHHDPIWRLPLWEPYKTLIESKIADINNAGTSSFAGAITAALFLKEFVGENIPWVHLDMFGWNSVNRPGRPIGGEACAQRALFALIESHISDWARSPRVIQSD